MNHTPTGALRPDVAAPNGRPVGVRATATALLAKGFWPVAIYPPGYVDNRGRKRIGKEPIGREWGLKRATLEAINDTFARYPGASLGICLGPGRGSHGNWLIDFEIDGAGGKESLDTLFGGEIPDTMGWLSARGGHTVLTADGERLLALLARCGASEGSGISSGVFKLPELPGLELRIGGFKPDGAVKQLQSVVPPSPTTGGQPREWTGGFEVAELPEAAYQFLERLAAEKDAAKAEQTDQPEQPRPQSRLATRAIGASAEKRARAYLFSPGFPESIEGQRGHDAIFRAACELIDGFGLGYNEAWPILTDWNEARARPPESAYQLDHKLRDAINKNPNPSLKRLNAERNGFSSRNGRVGGGSGNDRPAPDDGKLAKRPHTDLGNAERLVARHGNDIRYSHPWSKWLVWDGKRWAIDNTAAVKRLAKDTVRRMLDEANTIDDDDKRKAHIKWSLSSENKTRIESMLALASAEAGIPILHDEMDRDGWLFNCANGTIDLKTGKLREHRQSDLITKLCPVEFSPDAECPLWLETLKRFFDGKQELIDYWQCVCGYALVGVIRDHVMPVAYGKGSNGKSTILGTLMKVMGTDYAMKCPPDMLMAKKADSHPTDRADLFRKRLVVAIETESGRRLNETMVKELTGGDAIRARRMYEDFWEFQPTHTLLMATNHKPIIHGSDRGIWRRLKLVPFTVSVEGNEADKAMPEKLEAELPGILAWCVRGCLEWQSKGLVEPAEVLDATQEYRREQDKIGAFLDENVVRKLNAKVRASDLYARYKHWAERCNERALSSTMFGLEMKERGYEQKTSNGKLYLDIELRPFNYESGADEDGMEGGEI